MFYVKYLYNSFYFYTKIYVRYSSCYCGICKRSEKEAEKRILRWFYLVPCSIAYSMQKSRVKKKPGKAFCIDVVRVFYLNAGFSQFLVSFLFFSLFLSLLYIFTRTMLPFKPSKIGNS